MNRKLLSRFVLTALLIVLAACEQPDDTTYVSSCVVREYQEQAIVLDKSQDKRQAAKVSPSATNFNAFRSSFDPWLIEGFVSRRDRTTLRLEAVPVESIAELDFQTSFLVIVASQNYKLKELLSNYFEGKYRLININEACPIYVGKRNGVFALATIRDRQTTGGNENYRECAVISSLAYFGLPDSELSHFENYIKPDLLPNMWLYDTEKIKLLLSEKSSCE